MGILFACKDLLGRGPNCNFVIDYAALHRVNALNLVSFSLAMSHRTSFCIDALRTYHTYYQPHKQSLVHIYEETTGSKI